MAEDMRTCKYCGRETSKAANFCWYCARELDARPERPDIVPAAGKMNRWILAGACIVLVVVIFLIFNATLFH